MIALFVFIVCSFVHVVRLNVAGNYASFLLFHCRGTVELRDRKVKIKLFIYLGTGQLRFIL